MSKNRGLSIHLAVPAFLWGSYLLSLFGIFADSLVASICSSASWFIAAMMTSYFWTKRINFLESVSPDYLKERRLLSESLRFPGIRAADLFSLIDQVGERPPGWQAFGRNEKPRVRDVVGLFGGAAGWLSLLFIWVQLKNIEYGPVVLLPEVFSAFPDFWKMVAAAVFMFLAIFIGWFLLSIFFLHIVQLTTRITK